MKSLHHFAWHRIHSYTCENLYHSVSLFICKTRVTRISLLDIYTIITVEYELVLCHRSTSSSLSLLTIKIIIISSFCLNLIAVLLVWEMSFEICNLLIALNKIFE